MGTSLFSGRAEARGGLHGVRAVGAGLGAMVGAGVFAVLAPAARAAGVWLPLALAIAATVAYCSAVSEIRLALHHPGRGGAYVYGQRRLGEGWGLLAGWAFAVGAVAACTAVALTFGAHVWPGHPRAGALAVLAVVVALAWSGLRAPAGLAARGRAGRGAAAGALLLPGLHEPPGLPGARGPALARPVAVPVGALALAAGLARPVAEPLAGPAVAAGRAAVGVAAALAGPLGVGRPRRLRELPRGHARPGGPAVTARPAARAAGRAAPHQRWCTSGRISSS
ncbi:amino acid permease [Thermobifida cellulosilytica]|uniref:amino acid permease n=1 Tax=Thermobifida cellulosilytica TaxID=144786 RepID=UPI001E37EA57|nr:amino acid permease [Thermobifida cellulosilytica]